jgi:aspartate/methionine/tyrosine aminotransferase
VTKLAARMAEIQPFHVMALLARARSLEAEGRSVIHMEIGEPDFPSPSPIVEAGIAALQHGQTHYTPATGLPALREAIAKSYAPAVTVSPDRVVVAPGASGAFQLVFGTLIDPGDEVLMADPGYPCYRHFVRLFEGQAAMVPVGPATAYQLTAELVRSHWTARTRAVLLASPSNPTGTLVPPDELAAIVQTVAELGGTVIVDEIYHGLTYGVEAASALSLSDQVVVVNSFSKYFGMTGWRLGWLVAPASVAPAVDKLAQNIFLAASTPAQHAALVAFTPEVTAELQRRRKVFERRRDYLIPALRALGFKIAVVPEGAFYVYADCSAFTTDSFVWAGELLEATGVAVTPGLDFGYHRPAEHVRFSYANTLENLKEGVRRIGDFLNRD